MAFVGDLHMDVRDAFADKLKNRLLACIRIGDFRLDDEGRCRDVLHDVEWWQSADISEEDYRKTVKRFKDKWFNGDRSERLKPIVERKIEGLRKELIDMIGEE